VSNEGRVVLITGASAGIGRAAALAFARRGEKVGAVARRTDRLDQLVDEAKYLPGEVVPYAADVCDPVAMGRVVEDMVSRWNRFDILVANAGLGQRGPVADAAWEDLDVVLRTNIDGMLHSIRAAVPALRGSGGGQIITISSIVAVSITPYSTVYAATKAAVNGLVRGLRVELATDHIWITNVLVGQTHTEFAVARRGRPGKVAGKLPTMSADYVARCLVRESMRHRRTVTLRLLDRLIVAAGQFAPWITDTLIGRMYK